MKYECECIGNMKPVKSYGNYIHSKQTTALTLLLLTMINQIDKIMKLITCHAQT